MDRDGVTGLPGMSQVRGRIEELLAAGRTLAVYLVSVEGYDRLLASDADGAHHVLRQVARRLDRLVRGSDLLAVEGPGRFVLVATDVAPAVAGALVERVEGAAALPVEFDGATVSLQVRVGLALASEGGGAGDLLHRAADDLERVRRRG